MIGFLKGKSVDNSLLIDPTLLFYIKRREGDILFDISKKSFVVIAVYSYVILKSAYKIPGMLNLKLIISLNDPLKYL